MKNRIKQISCIMMISTTVFFLFYTGYIPVKNLTELTYSQQTSIESSGTGKIQVTVVDGFTETPLQNAAVVIPEINGRFTTDQQGKTPLISIPFEKDQHFKNILEKPWTEITLLVYKNGYVDYALFYTQVFPNQTRYGPKILMFKETSGKSNEPLSIIEGPQRTWVDQLLKKYRNDQQQK